MPTEDTDKLEPAAVAQLYLEHEEELKKFLLGVLRDSQRVHDALQAAFIKLTECGHTARAETRKAWLFRVAYNEAMGQLRRESTTDRVLKKAVWSRHVKDADAADLPVLRLEAVQRVQEAIHDLPSDLQQVVRMRVYEEKTFVQIARELNIPLGTALGRMRAALGRLRHKLEDPPET